MITVYQNHHRSHVYIEMLKCSDPYTSSIITTYSKTVAWVPGGDASSLRPNVKRPTAIYNPFGRPLNVTQENPFQPFRYDPKNNNLLGQVSATDECLAGGADTSKMSMLPIWTNGSSLPVLGRAKIYEPPYVVSFDKTAYGRGLRKKESGGRSVQENQRLRIDGIGMAYSIRGVGNGTVDFAILGQTGATFRTVNFQNDHSTVPLMAPTTVPLMALEFNT